MKQNSNFHSLFTLNESVQSVQPKLKLDNHIKSQESSVDEFSQIQDQNTSQQLHQEQISKFHDEIEELKMQASQIKLQNKELKDMLSINELRTTKHQQKQRELIKKLSHEQISNKQLEFEIQKLTEQNINYLSQISRIKESSKYVDRCNIQIQNQLLKGQEQRALFIQSFKKISDVLLKCQRIEDFHSCVGKFVEFIRKNIKGYELLEPDSDFEFDLKFEVNHTNMLKSKIFQLESVVQRLREQNQKQKQDKKRIITIFNDKIIKLKQQCDELRLKVEQKDNQMEFEIISLKKAVNEKNQIISELKYKFDSEKKKKESVCSRKSRANKRSYYISDGERQGDIQMNQLQNEIEHLQKLLIDELGD